MTMLLRHLTLVVLAAALALCFTSTPARAQNAAALISEQMDRLVDLEIDATLPSAIKLITDRTGVPIEVQPAAWDALPWGEQTHVKATIKNKTLRDALDAMTQSLGLTFEVKDQAVELQPQPALRRLGKRATASELTALETLRKTKLGLPGDRATVGDVLNAVDKKLAAAKAEFAIENRANDELDPKQSIFVAKDASLADALEAIAKETKATWYPWGQAIVVLGKEEQTSMQLNKPIDISYNAAEIGQVLLDLSTKSGVDFQLEPGALQRVPPDFRRIKLVATGKSTRDILEQIMGQSGLSYLVNDRGVYLWHNTATGGAAARERAVGIITLPSGMQVLLTESQVPPDLREYLQHKTGQELDKLRVMMQEEGFKPKEAPKDPAKEPLN